MDLEERTNGSHKPTDWSYNPSEWSQRLPIVSLATVGFGVALYLALYQWRVIGSVWEPFFGGGSEKILNSGISRVLPVPDAALGAFGYLVDAVTGIVGSTKRWRTMPWIVIVFGIAVGPLGAREHTPRHIAARHVPCLVHALSNFGGDIRADDRTGH